MNADDLREEIEIELENMAATLAEIEALARLVVEREPTNIEKAAAGAFLGQLYNGLENIMKRICRHLGQAIPEGPKWHEELFRMFCEPAQEGLPVLFSPALEQALESYRRFRHLFVHGYAVLLDWPRMKAGVEQAPQVFGEVFALLRAYLQNRNALLEKGDTR